MVGCDRPDLIVLHHEFDDMSGAPHLPHVSVAPRIGVVGSNGQDQLVALLSASPIQMLSGETFRTSIGGKMCGVSLRGLEFVILGGANRWLAQ